MLSVPTPAPLRSLLTARPAAAAILPQAELDTRSRANIAFPLPVVSEFSEKHGPTEQAVCGEQGISAWKFHLWPEEEEA